MSAIRVAGCALTMSLLVVGCIDQPTSPEHISEGQPDGIAKPLFSHAPPPSYSYTVAANNYHLDFNDRGLLWVSPVTGAGTYKGQTVMFGGSIAYGTGDRAVYFYNTSLGRGSFKGTWPPFWPVDEFAPGPFADHQTVSVMLESVDAEFQSRAPIGLVTIRETFAYANPPDDDYVVVKYTLINPHDEDLTGLHVGQELDIDVGFSDDWVRYDPTKQLAFVATVWTDVESGHVALTGTVSTYQRWRSSSSRPVTPDMTDPATLAGWYGLLSGGMADTGFWGPSDIRHLLAEGPVTIPAGGSRVVAFALVAGDDRPDLYANVDAALDKWASLPAEATGPYVQPLTSISIAPRVLNLAAPGVFSVVFEFASTAAAAQAELDGVICSGARPFRGNKASGQTVRAFFKTEDLNAEMRDGDPIACDGRLSDGTRYVGADAPTLLRAFTPVTRLTFDPADDVDPSWSPDGTSIVFASDRGRDPGDYAIWRMEIAAGEASAVQLTALGGSPVGSGLQPDWSPDGSTIVFGGGHIVSVPANGGPLTQLTQPSLGPNWYPRYSPDGTEIAFRREPGPEIWKMAAEGELVGPAAVPLATDGFWHDHPAWSPDGERIFFLSARPGPSGFGIYAVDATTGEPAVRVTPDEEFGAHYSEPTVSPDGRTLAFLSGGTSAGSSIILQDLRSGTHRALLMDPPRAAWPFWNIEFSPDGRDLLFVSGGDIYIADVSKH